MFFLFTKRENGEKSFPKLKMTSSNVLFSQQPKHTQFTVREEERNQKIFKKLESESYNALLKKKKRYLNLID